MSRATERAKTSLTHYIRLCAKASGVRWDRDNDAEVEAIVDDILDAATSAAEERFVAKPFER